MAPKQGEVARCERCGAQVQFLRHRGSGRLAPIEQQPNWKGSFLVDQSNQTYWTDYEPRSPLRDYWENHLAVCRQAHFVPQPQPEPVGRGRGAPQPHPQEMG
jgi:hypothetical protein